MVFKPLAFKYLHQMCSPGGHFTTFGVPTSIEVTKPGFYSPVQGRMWKVSRAVAEEVFGTSVSVMTVNHIVIEVWNDRSSTWHAPQFELMGYALVLEPDLEQLITQGVMTANIVYSS